MKYIDILVKLRKILRSINLESKRIEKKFGVSIPQLLILQFISDQTDYQASAKEIKNYLNLNASTVSGIISRLTAKGLIAKLEKSVDKRISLITLTAKGLEILKESPTTLQEKLSMRLSNLSHQQIEDLNANIDILIQLLDAEDIDASPLLFNKEIPSEK